MSWTNPLSRMMSSITRFFKKPSTKEPEPHKQPEQPEQHKQRHFNKGCRCSDGSVQSRTLKSWRTANRGHRFPCGSRNQQVASDHDVRCWDIMNGPPKNGAHAQ